MLLLASNPAPDLVFMFDHGSKVRMWLLRLGELIVAQGLIGGGEGAGDAVEGGHVR